MHGSWDWLGRGGVWVLLAALAAGPSFAAEMSFAERLAQAEALVNQDARAAEVEARAILAGAEAVGDTAAIGTAQRVLGRSLNVRGDNEAALAAFQAALASLPPDASVDRALLLRHMGVVYFDLAQRDLALSHYLQALAIFEAAAATEEVAKTRANIANVHYINGDLERAASAHRQALQAFESVPSPLGIAGSALNLSAVLSAQAGAEDVDAAQAEALRQEAAAAARKARTVFRALNIPRGVQKAESNLASIQLAQGKLHQALGGLRRALELARQIGDRAEEVLALKRIIDAERKLGNLDAALTAASEGLRLAEAGKQLEDRERFHRDLSAINEALGRAPAALQHARLAESIAAERERAAMDLRIEALTREFENQQRDHELEQLRHAQELAQAELGRQRLQRNTAIVIGVLALAVLALLYSKLRLRERARRDLEQAAQTDPLTGLLNRRGLRDWVEAQGAQLSLALILADVDNFKRINDGHGHDIGDAVLAEVARRLQAELRAEDRAARWGGEEFMLLLPRCDAAAAGLVAERLRLAVAGTPIRGIEVTLSLGLAVRQGGAFDEATRAADHALLSAKREGKNRVALAPPKVVLVEKRR